MFVRFNFRKPQGPYGATSNNIKFSEILSIQSNDETIRKRRRSVSEVKNRQCSRGFLREISQYEGVVLQRDFRLPRTRRTRVALQSFSSEIKRQTEGEAEKKKRVAWIRE